MVRLWTDDYAIVCDSLFHAPALLPNIVHAVTPRLNDEPAEELSKVLTEVRLSYHKSICSPSTDLLPISISIFPLPFISVFASFRVLQTFRARLPEIIDQAQHFASLQASTGAGSRGGDASVASFREGMDGTERECGYLISCPSPSQTPTPSLLRAMTSG